MIRPLPFIFLFLLLSVAIKGQPNLVFANVLVDSSQSSRASGLALDAAGNSYVTGRFAGNADFDPTLGTALRSAVGQGDIFIAKYSAGGAYQWVISMGGTAEDGGYSITLDASGNIMITGSFGGTMDFDPSPAVANVSSNGAGDIFVAKYSNTGVYLWAFAMGSVANDAGLSLSNDAQGNCYITGYYMGTTDFDPSGATSVLPSNGKDIFIAKYNANGLYQWAIHVDGDTADVGRGIKSDPSGNCYVTGSFGNNADFDPSINTSILTTAANKNNTFLAKYDSNGNYLWAFGIYSAFFNQGNGLALDASGNVFMTGYLQGLSIVADFDPSPNSVLLTAQNQSAFVAKYSSAGAYQWAFLIGSGTAIGNAISTDAAGNCYVTGLFEGGPDFDPSPAASQLFGGAISHVFVAKYDNNGLFQWVFKLGSSWPLDFYHQAIANDALGNTYVTSPLNLNFGPGDFDPTPGTYILSGAYMSLAKYSSCGAPSMPTANTNTVNQTICAGSSASLSAIGPGTISWYATPASGSALGTGTTLITPTLSAGMYTFYASAATCTTSFNKTPVTVTVNALPGIIISSAPPVICAGQSTTLSATGALTYTWNNQANGDSLVVAPGIATTYTVSGIGANACTGSAAITVSVDLCMGLGQLSGSAQVTVYPVPAKNELHLELTGTEFTRIEIVSLTGQVLVKEDLNQGHVYTIDVRSLPDGVYLLNIICAGSKTTSKRLIVCKN